MAYLCVAIGGAVGSLLRFCISELFARYGGSVPWAIFLINGLGCFIIGFVAAFAFFHGGVSAETKILLMSGFCGGFSTLSAVSLDALRFVQTGRWGAAILDLLGTAVMGLVAAWIGYRLGICFKAG